MPFHIAIRCSDSRRATSSGSRPVTVNQRVGASPGRRSPSTATPSIVRRPASSLSPSACSSAHPSGTTRSSMKRAAARTPASCSNGRVPSSHRSGTVSGEGTSLSGCSSARRDGSALNTPTCGPYHLYAEQTTASAPQPCRSIRRWGVAATASMYVRTPASRARAHRAATSGAVPVTFDVAFTAIHRVRSDTTAATCSGSRASVSRSGSAKRTVAPARSAASTHGRTLPSWSSRVTTTSSPGLRDRPTAAANRIVSDVIDSPKTMLSCWPPRSSAHTCRVDRTSASVASACGKGPCALAASPDRHQAVEASMASSTAWVPAGPSSRTQSSRSPGKRSRSTQRW